MPLKFLTVVFLFFATTLCLSPRAAYGDESGLQFSIAPSGARLSPSDEPASLALTVTERDGQPAREGSVLVRLDAPPPDLFISTDFPVVEGTRLLEMRLPVTNGKAEWRQMLPIRGEYRLTAAFASTAGSKTTKVFAFDVYESSWKWLVFGAFTSGLFIAGVVAGRVFSGPRKRNRKVKRVGSWFVLGLLCYGAVGEAILARDVNSRNDQATLDIAPAAVGAPTLIRWRLNAARVEDKPVAKLTLTITHLEKNLIVFVLKDVSVAGEFAFDYQFTDGSDHRVAAIAQTVDRGALRQEQIVSVTAVPPPLRAKLKTTLLFLMVIAAGLAVGRWTRTVSRAGRAA